MRKIKLAFEPQSVTLSLEKILPSRTVPEHIRDSKKYRCIRASVEEIGIVEPLVVFPQSGTDGRYVLLDGNVRYNILKELGRTKTLCLIATDDEAYTFNHKVNHISPIQEHFMILRAIENGVSEERIAKALHVNVTQIRQKRDLLNGVCPEAVNLLKERRVPIGTFREMKKVSPMRQIEMAELMISVNNYSGPYARCLFAATVEHDRIEAVSTKETAAMLPDERDRMRREIDMVHREFKVIEETHSENVLNLVVAVGYLRRLLNNARVIKHLYQHFPDIVQGFQQITDAPELTATAAKQEIPGRR